VGHPGLHHTYIEVNPFQVKRLLASLLAVNHARLLLPTSFVPAAARFVLSAGVSSYFIALASSSFCQNLTTISHICSAGRQLLHGLHGFVPSGLIYHLLLGVLGLVLALLVLLLFPPGVISFVPS
jgi:hypothetical protein